MSRRLVVAAALCALAAGPIVAAPAAAQDASANSLIRVEPADGAPSFITSLSVALPRVDFEQIGRLPAPPPPRPTRSRPSPLLSSLYVSTAALQALDVHSTLSALQNGAVEANPVMSGLTRNRGAFIAVKALVATSTILASRQLAKRNKVAAVITLVAVNSAYAYVAHHNYKLARAGR